MQLRAGAYACLSPQPARRPSLFNGLCENLLISLHFVHSKLSICAVAVAVAVVFVFYALVSEKFCAPLFVVFRRFHNSQFIVTVGNLSLFASFKCRTKLHISHTFRRQG